MFFVWNFLCMIWFNLLTNTYTLNWVFVVEFVLQDLNHQVKNHVYIRISYTKHPNSRMPYTVLRIYLWIYRTELKSVTTICLTTLRPKIFCQNCWHLRVPALSFRVKVRCIILVIAKAQVNINTRKQTVKQWDIIIMTDMFNKCIEWLKQEIPLRVLF